MNDSNSHDADEIEEKDWCYYCGAEQEGWFAYEDLEEMSVCPQCMFLFVAKHCFSKVKNGVCTEDNPKLGSEVCPTCHNRVQNEPHEPAFFILPPDIEPML